MKRSRPLPRTMELLDLSSYEYTPYFFEDNTHIAREGWVKLNEGLYQFASQGLSE